MQQATNIFVVVGANKILADNTKAKLKIPD